MPQKRPIRKPRQEIIDGAGVTSTTLKRSVSRPSCEERARSSVVLAAPWAGESHPSSPSRQDPARSPTSAGVASPKLVVLQNHGPGYEGRPALMSMEDADTQRRKHRPISCPPPTDPLAFSHLRGHTKQERSLRRIFGVRRHNSPSHGGRRRDPAILATSQEMLSALQPNPDFETASSAAASARSQTLRGCSSARELQPHPWSGCSISVLSGGASPELPRRSPQPLRTSKSTSEFSTVPVLQHGHFNPNMTLGLKGRELLLNQSMMATNSGLAQGQHHSGSEGNRRAGPAPKSGLNLGLGEGGRTCLDQVLGASCSGTGSADGVLASRRRYVPKDQIISIGNVAHTHGLHIDVDGPVKLTSQPAPVLDPEQSPQAMRQRRRDFGRGLIANTAGLASNSDVASLSDNGLLVSLCNSPAPVLSHAESPQLMRQRRRGVAAGLIVNMASLAAHHEWEDCHDMAVSAKLTDQPAPVLPREDSPQAMRQRRRGFAAGEIKSMASLAAGIRDGHPEDSLVKLTDKPAPVLRRADSPKAMMQLRQESEGMIVNMASLSPRPQDVPAVTAGPCMASMRQVVSTKWATPWIQVQVPTHPQHRKQDVEHTDAGMCGFAKTSHAKHDAKVPGKFIESAAPSFGAQDARRGIRNHRQDFGGTFGANIAGLAAHPDAEADAGVAGKLTENPAPLLGALGLRQALRDRRQDFGGTFAANMASLAAQPDAEGDAGVAGKPTENPAPSLGAEDLRRALRNHRQDFGGTIAANMASLAVHPTDKEDLLIVKGNAQPQARLRPMHCGPERDHACDFSGTFGPNMAEMSGNGFAAGKPSAALAGRQAPLPLFAAWSDASSDHGLWSDVGSTCSARNLRHALGKR